MSKIVKCYEKEQSVGGHPHSAEKGNKRHRIAAKNAISSCYFTLLVVLVLILGVTACSPGSGETAVTPAPTEAPAEPTAEPVEEPTEEPVAEPTEEIAAEEAVAETAELDSTASPLPRTITDMDGSEVVIEDDSRIIALEGPVTEIVYALGAGDRLVATDVSSTYPKAATQLPQVGYVRQLSAEPILAVDPSLIITTDQAGPPEAMAQLRESGVPIAMFASASSIEESYALIRSIAQTLGLEAKGEELIAQMEADLAEAEALLERVETTPRVLFIYARGADTVMGGGLDTGVDVILAMAGAENAITEFEGYQPLTAEAAVTAAPDAYLLFTSGLESVGGAEGLLQVPGLAQTPAGENGQVFAMDGLLLTGFGPRVGQAVIELIHLLHPEVE
jgi:iron complex transport system substrate-binding protein